jgi:hypothetical protein
MKKLFLNHLIMFLTKSSILVGGQAVIEGVMMRVPGFISTAVRKPDGEIITNRHEFVTLTAPLIIGTLRLGCLAVNDTNSCRLVIISPSGFRTAVDINPGTLIITPSITA